MDYMLKRWGTFSRFLTDGRICLTNNAASMYSLIVTAKLNDVDPRAWLADVLALHDMLPWNWKQVQEKPPDELAA